MRKLLLFLLLGVFTFSSFLFSTPTEAVTSVKGYYRKNGTYVAPHYRSDPDGIFSNNWSTKGNVNPYTGKVGTKVVPSTNYYGGVTQPQTGSNYTKTDVNSNGTTNLPANASPSIYGGWYCNSGFKKNYSTSQCDKIIVPPNAKLNIFGDDWYCNSGYKKNYNTNQCDQIIIPPNAKLDYWGSDWVCNAGFRRNYQTNQCNQIIVPENARLDYWGSDWICDRGYKRNYQFQRCDQIIIPPNAQLDYLGSDFICNEGFRRDYITNICLPQ